MSREGYCLAARRSLQCPYTDIEFICDENKSMENLVQFIVPRDDEVATRVRRLEQMIAQYVGEGSGGVTDVPGLAVARLSSAGGPACYLYEPSLCIATQGSKRVDLGGTTYRYDERTFLLTAVGLPAIVQIERASAETPYTSLQLCLDLDMARQLIADMASHGLRSAPAVSGMVTAPLTTELLDPMVRLVELLGRREEIPILAAGIHREIIYRLLISPEGERLKQMVRQDTQGNRLANAIAWLRQNFKHRLRIEELADEAGMAISTLHHQFKAVTNMSPLQFQKHLRLNEARRLMLTENLHAGVAALQVGYESVTQFNREYRRLFGAPPKQDVHTLQASNLQPNRAGTTGDAQQV
jgi:AraC-like DNA-binding protein